MSKKDESSGRPFAYNFVDAAPRKSDGEITMAKFKKGDPRPPNAGRKKGQKNRVNLAFKDCVVEVLERGGGAEWLLRWAKKHQTEFFKIAARLIPQEITGKLQSEHTVTDDTRRLLEALNPEQLHAVAAVLAQAGRVADIARREDGLSGKESRGVH